MQAVAKKEAFIALKDHKENFDNTLPCRLKSSAKSEMGIVSKNILQRIATTIKAKPSVNQWQNSLSVIEWFCQLKEMTNMSFLYVDIIRFYPFVPKELLTKTLSFAKLHASITQQDMDIIFHSRMSLLFNNGKSWVQKESRSLFMSLRAAIMVQKFCELVGAFILSEFAQIYNSTKIGLYRDDGLAVFRNMTGRDADKTRKTFIKIVNSLDLRIAIQTNMKTVNILDVTLNRTNGVNSPYRKPNDKPTYITK